MQKTLFKNVAKSVAKVVYTALDYIVIGLLIVAPVVLVKPELVSSLTYIQFIVLLLATRVSIEVITEVVRDTWKGK